VIGHEAIDEEWLAGHLLLEGDDHAVHTDGFGDAAAAVGEQPVVDAVLSERLRGEAVTRPPDPAHREVAPLGQVGLASEERVELQRIVPVGVTLDEAEAARDTAFGLAHPPP
jgi:hypothetical protein